MKYSYIDEIYVIREISTGRLLKFGNKTSWINIGAAKNAFNLHMTIYFNRNWSEMKGLYDTQDLYKIERISSYSLVESK